jgi:F-type H+-transporting ATPase subunit a
LKNPFVQLLVVLAASALFCVAPAVLLPRAGIPVAFPHVQMPTEKVFLEPLFNIGTIPVYLFNTLPSVILADIILLVMALTAGAAARKRLRQYEADHMSVDEEGHDQMVPKGWLNAFEAILEYIYNLVESVVGSKWADKVFPLIMTIFLFVLTINWLHFVPGVDSIGIVHCAEPGKAKGFEIAELGNSGIYRLATSSEVGATGVAPTYGEEACQQAHHAAVGGEHDEQAEKPEILYTIAPFMRTASTDLNITLSIALVAVVSVQVFGVREIMKIVAFSLRLFGNMFAGAILLFVMMFLIPVGVPVIFFLLEVLIGAIQAFVFALLTLVFVSLAMIGHGDHDDEEHG